MLGFELGRRKTMERDDVSPFEDLSRSDSCDDDLPFFLPSAIYFFDEKAVCVMKWGSLLKKEEANRQLN